MVPFGERGWEGWSKPFFFSSGRWQSTFGITISYCLEWCVVWFLFGCFNCVVRCLEPSIDIFIYLNTNEEGIKSIVAFSLLSRLIFSIANS